MNPEADTDIEALKRLLEEQRAEIIRLLEKVSHLEDMVFQMGNLCVPCQPQQASLTKPIPRRWRVGTLMAKV